MPKKDAKSATTNPAGASRFLAGASSLVLLQVITRVVTFFLNQMLVRLSTPQIFGTAAIQFELLLSTILFISREGVRLALLRSSSQPEKEEEKADDQPKTITEKATPKSKSSKSTRNRKGNQSVTEEIAVSQDKENAAEVPILVSNIATLPVILGIPLSVALPLAYMYTASSETSSQPYFHASIIIYTLSALVQLAAEPMYILAQRELDFNVRLRSEASGVISRAAVTVAVLILAKRFDKMGENAKGEGYEWGLLAFALGQLAYGVFVFATYLWTYRARKSEWRWWPKSVTVVEKAQ
jgi:oligosaccharide translocation protein RFT1